MSQPTPYDYQAVAESTEVEYLGGRFEGSLRVQGSKHAFAHTLATTAMADSGRIENVPQIADSQVLIGILSMVFAEVDLSGAGVLTFGAPRQVDLLELDEGTLSGSRNIYCLIPALLNRARVVRLAGEPTGCEFAHRPAAWYFNVLTRFGASVLSDGDHTELRWPVRRPAEVQFPYPSLSGTVIALAAAAGCHGESMIGGAATDPSVQDQFSVLSGMDCRVRFEGRTICVSRTRPNLVAHHAVLRPDQEVAATLLAALALAGGELELTSDQPFDMRRFVPLATKMNLRFEEHSNRINARANSADEPDFGGPLIAGAHPNLSSDWMPAAAVALAGNPARSGKLIDTMFPDRFKVLPLLSSKGFPDVAVKVADFNGRTSAIVEFPSCARGPYRGGVFDDLTDTRTSAAVLISSIVATGPVRLSDTRHLRRAYECLPANLGQIGRFAISASTRESREADCAPTTGRG